MFLYFIFCFVVPAIIYFGGQWAYRGFKEHPNVDALESKTDKDKDRDSYFAQMELKYKSTMEKLETVRMQRKDIEKAVALLQTQEKEESEQPATGGNNNKEAVKMKFDEVKETFSSELAGIEKAGEDKGKADMIANNKAIMEFKNKDEYKNLLHHMPNLYQNLLVLYRKIDFYFLQ